MWPIAILAIVWIAGIVGAKMAQKTPEQGTAEERAAKADAAKQELEEKKLKLDALKAIRDSSFQRWDKRRSFEWQVSISIWTALSAFSALVISKDFTVSNNIGTAIGVAVIGGFASIVQYRYLNDMFTHSVGDVGIQRWAEREIYRLAFDPATSDAPPRKVQLDYSEPVLGIPLYVHKPPHRNKDKDRKDADPTPPPDGAVERKLTKKEEKARFELYPNLGRSGLAKVYITVILTLAAALAVLNRAPQKPPTDPTPTTTNNFFNQASQPAAH